MEAKLFNKTDTGLLTVLSSVSVGSSFKQLKCLWNPVPMVAPPWPTQTPPIYSLNPSPLSQNMGRTQQVPSSPPLYAIWCSSARVVVDLICWIWSKRNVVLQSVSKCPTDLYNKLLLSFPIWYNIRTDFVRLPLYCCQVALHWCCQTDGVTPSMIEVSWTGDWRRWYPDHKCMFCTCCCHCHQPDMDQRPVLTLTA